jgi:DNA-binding transcriptional MerR regulator
MAWLPSSAVRERYRGLKPNQKSISYKTLDRWVERGILPQPVYFGGRRYWDDNELDRRDAARAAPHCAKEMPPAQLGGRR